MDILLQDSKIWLQRQPILEAMLFVNVVGGNDGEDPVEIGALGEIKDHCGILSQYVKTCS